MVVTASQLGGGGGVLPAAVEPAMAIGSTESAFVGLNNDYQGSGNNLHSCGGGTFGGTASGSGSGSDGMSPVDILMARRT